MLTREDNQMLTRVDAGSPGGQLLRRYWQPVAIASELTDEKPIMRVRVLGEDLVAYRDKKGSYGLVAEHCPHRMASLAYGRVDAEGIRCPYHGWKFNAAGRCVEQPAEPKGSTYKDEIQQPAYPVQKLGGLLFAYMGPLPAPALPRWDVLAWENGRRWIQKQELLNCNWLQCMENSVDPSHLYWLHGASAHLGKLGQYDEKHEFITFEFGIMKRRTTGVSGGERGETDQHPLLFPNILRHVLKTKNQKEGKIRHNLQFRLPVDDTHTQVFVCFFEPSETEHTSPDADVPFEPLAVRNEDGKYRLEQVLVQDAMAWETQGQVMDRSREHLGTGDKGVVIFRKLVREQIEIVRRGGTPLGCLPKDQERPLIELDVINERIGVGSHKRDVA